MHESTKVADRVLTVRDGADEHLSEERPRANILGVGVDAVDMDGALRTIERHLMSDRKGYVCAVGVHGILESLRSDELKRAYAESTINVPDGAPTVWVGRLQGFRRMDHVTGPALMREVFQRGEFSPYSHFFYGGKPGVAQELAATMLQEYPWTRVAGTYTPPFRELIEHEERDVVTMINAVRPDIIWVGISTPRQDLWMRRILPLLQTRLMFGVGAAFDFYTGRIRECAPWVKRAGLHWLHRLAQDPKRLWRRNVSNTAFLWHIALQLSGAREYPMSGPTANREALPRDRRAAQIYSGAEPADAVRSSRRQ
jgi:N-acetylglucosaminyldiphosphoundecaprenol N-acetyl-beta-D-mannosaminyltransferase